MKRSVISSLLLLSLILALCSCTDRRASYFAEGRFYAESEGKSYYLEVTEITESEFDSADGINVVRDSVRQDRYFRLYLRSSQGCDIMEYSFINLKATSFGRGEPVEYTDAWNWCLSPRGDAEYPDPCYVLNMGKADLNFATKLYSFEELMGFDTRSIAGMEMNNGYLQSFRVSLDKEKASFLNIDFRETAEDIYSVTVGYEESITPPGFQAGIIYLRGEGANADLIFSTDGYIYCYSPVLNKSFRSNFQFNRDFFEGIDLFSQEQLDMIYQQ